MLFPSAKILCGESQFVVWKREQCSATIPFLAVDFPEGSVGQIDVPDSISGMKIAVSTKVDSALPDG